jgi:beta-barrel assembly-enhancing protease
MPILPDSDLVTQYVRRLGTSLVNVIPEEHSWPYQFHVIQQKEINAFALPGGPIFINIGTINAADNEAELAGSWHTRCLTYTCSIRPSKLPGSNG